nr:retrovirus-related Pol polyprotein from transposon TNT 1-94 [Tanacetum cinerariifolium]
MVTPAPQDKWSQDKHIKLVNIISNQGARILTRAMAKQLSAASAHERLMVDFLSKEEPKKVSEAPNHLGWVDAMQDELNQFARNKVRTLVPEPYVKTPIVPPNNLEPDLNGKSINETQYRANPKESHLIDVKRIFKYLKGKAPQVAIFCDDTSAIAISNNPVLHLRTKHIDIRYYFIRDYVLKETLNYFSFPLNINLLISSPSL